MVRTRRACAAEGLSHVMQLAMTADVLSLIALHGGAACLVQMLKTSQAWRAILLADANNLWKMLCLRRFSRLRHILEHASPPTDFRLVYQQQLAAEHPEAVEVQEPTFPSLTEYIFTVEVHTRAVLIGSWSGALSSASDFLPIQWSLTHFQQELIEKGLRERAITWTPAPTSLSEFFDSIKCSISVTRRTDLATIVLYTQTGVDDVDYAFGHDYDAGPSVNATETFWRLPMEDPPGSEVLFGGTDGPHSGYNDTFTIDPSITIGSATSDGEDGLDLGFKRSNYDELEYLEDTELCKYLFLAPWPKLVTDP